MVDRCRVKLKGDPVLGWRLKLDGDCSRELEVVAGLPASKKRYIRKRIET